tara:strand:+ start:908 stop:1213 length:306 start_codon:yes stop_codon:yes gene_type:complete
MSLNGNTMGTAISTAALAAVDKAALADAIRGALPSDVVTITDAAQFDSIWEAIGDEVLKHVFSTAVMQALAGAIVTHITSNAAVSVPDIAAGSATATGTIS